MEHRIIFRSEVHIEGKDFEEIKNIFEKLNLYSEEARKNKASFIKIDNIGGNSECFINFNNVGERISFKSKILISGKDNEDIMLKFANMNLYSEEAKKYHIGFINIDSVEDTKTNKDVFDDGMEDDSDIILCPYCDSDAVIVKSSARNKNDYTFYECLDCGNEFSI